MNGDTRSLTKVELKRYILAQLVKLHMEGEELLHCPFCGTKYESQAQLIAAINSKQDEKEMGL